MLCLQPEFIFKKNNGSKLRGVVLNVEAVLLALDDGMASTHTDIIDSHLTLVATAELEF